MGRNKKQQKGVITLYFAIIMPCLLAFLIGLFDFTRVFAARNQVYMAGSNAMDAALANYERDLFEKYGLLAYTGGDDVSSELKDIFMKNIDAGYNLDGVNKFDLYKLNATKDDLQVAFTNNLFTDNNVFSNQMIKDMKYRSVENLALGILDKFEKNEIAKKETEIAEKLEDLQDEMSDKEDELEDIREGEERLYALMCLYGVNTYDLNGARAQFPRIFTEAYKKNYFIGKNNTFDAYKFIKEYNTNSGDKNKYKNYVNKYFENIFNAEYLKLLILAHDRQVEKDKDKYDDDMSKYRKELAEYNKEKKEWDKYDKDQAKPEEDRTGVEKPSGSRPKEPIKPSNLEDYKKNKLSTNGGANNIRRIDDFIKLQFTASGSKGLNDIVKDVKKKLNKALKEIDDNIEFFKKIEKDLNDLQKEVQKLPSESNEFKTGVEAQIEEYLKCISVEKMNTLKDRITKAIESCNFILGPDSNNSLQQVLKRAFNQIEESVKNGEGDYNISISDENRKKLYKDFNSYKNTKIESYINETIKNNKAKDESDVKKVVRLLKDTFKNKFVNDRKITTNGMNKFTFDINVELKVPKENLDDDFWDSILDLFKEMKKLVDDESLIALMDEMKTGVSVPKAGLPSGAGTTNKDDLKASTIMSYEKPDNFAASSIDKLYMVEYIMTNFKSMVKKGDRVPEMTDLTTKLSNEIEAIMFPNNNSYSDDDCIKKVVGILMAERMAFNFVGFFCDEGLKRRLVKNIATGLSAGFLPVKLGIMAVLITGWVTFESYLDVKDLLKGGTVPLIKNVDNWVTDIKFDADEAGNIITKPNSSNMEDVFNIGKDETGFANKQDKKDFNYHDYIRLNLLAIDTNKLINGAKDLIVTNIREEKEFDYTDKFSAIEVNVDSKMNMLFDLSSFNGGSGSITFKTQKLKKGYN